MSFRNADHLAASGRGIRADLEDAVRGAGHELPGGRVELLTHRRVFGYVFNPVSVFYCYDRAGRLELAVAEVNNTYGDRHCHVLPVEGDPFEDYARHCDWIQKHVFPGSLLGSLHHVTGAMSRVSRLGVHHLEDVAPHYALTLARWRQAFLARLDRVRELGFDERFIRTWHFYVAGCEAYFATRRLGDLQLVLTRPGNASLRGIPARRPAAA